jgi:hypothetical protein
MAGPSASVSRDFFDLAKQYAYLLYQEGTPNFDANLNFSGQLEHWNRRYMAEAVAGDHMFVGGTANNEGFNVTQATSTTQNFQFGLLNTWVHGSATEYIADPSATSPIDYTSTSNYLFSGTVTSVSSNDIYDTSKAYRTKHYLTGCRLYMTSGTESGNSFAITSFSSTYVTCSGGVGTIAQGDTFLILPPALTTPSGADRDDDVYLMLFIEDMDELEDTDLKDPTTNLTECHAIQRRWCVRVDEGQTGSWSEDVGYVTFHKIALLERLNGNATVTTAMITDDPDKIKLVSLGNFENALVNNTTPRYYLYTNGMTSYGNILPDSTGQDLGSTTKRWDLYAESVTCYGNIVPDATGNNLGSITYKWDVYANTLGIYNNVDTNIVPAATGQDLGSTSARWDAYLENTTSYGNLLPSATGNDLGSTGARFDAFLETTAVYGTITSSYTTIQNAFKMSAAKSHKKMLNLTGNMGGSTSSSWMYNNSVTSRGIVNTGDGYSFYIPVDLPHGCYLTTLVIRYYQAANQASDMAFYLYYVVNGTATTIDNGTVTTFGSAADLTLTANTTIDKEAYRYELRVDAAGTATTCEVRNVTANYTISDIGLAAADGGAV